MFYVGVFVIAVGCLFLALGAAQVVSDIMLSFRSRSSVATQSFAADDVNALAALIAAIAKLPPFALMVGLGLLLLAVGDRMVSGLHVLSY